MGTNEFYYNKGVRITCKEAHDLKDKSGLVVSDRDVDFSKEFKGTKKGLVEFYDAKIDAED